MPDSQDKIPKYLEGRRKTVRLGNLDPSDYTWIGEDGKLDTAKIIEVLLSPDFALRAIVSAIIKAGEGKEHEHQTRIDAAMNALVGTATRVGPKEKPLLEKEMAIIAREFFLDFFGFKSPKRSITALCIFAISQRENFNQMSADERGHQIRVLRRKFEANKNKYLVQVSLQNSDEFKLRSIGIKSALSSLEKLGIPIASFNDLTDNPK